MTNAEISLIVRRAQARIAVLQECEPAVRYARLTGPVAPTPITAYSGLASERALVRVTPKKARHFQPRHYVTPEQAPEGICDFCGVAPAIKTLTNRRKVCNTCRAEGWPEWEGK